MAGPDSRSVGERWIKADAPVRVPVRLIQHKGTNATETSDSKRTPKSIRSIFRRPLQQRVRTPPPPLYSAPGRR